MIFLDFIVAWIKFFRVKLKLGDRETERWPIGCMDGCRKFFDKFFYEFSDFLKPPSNEFANFLSRELFFGRWTIEIW